MKNDASSFASSQRRRINEGRTLKNRRDFTQSGILGAFPPLTLDVGALDVRDVTVHKTGGVGLADVTRKRGQIGVARVVKDVVLSGHEGEAHE